MILYDYQCANGHRFEQMAELSDFDKAVPCRERGCRMHAARVIVQPPGLNFKVIDQQQRTYHEHNITHVIKTPTVTSLPNSPADQCQCGDCGSHRRRMVVTNVADKGKERFI